MSKFQKRFNSNKAFYESFLSFWSMEVNHIPLGMLYCVLRVRHFKWVYLNPLCMTLILPWLSMGQITPWPDLVPIAQLLIILSMPDLIFLKLMPNFELYFLMIYDSQTPFIGKIWTLHHKHSIKFLGLMLPQNGTYVFYHLQNILPSFLTMNYQKVQLHTTYHWTQVSKKSLAGPVMQTLCSDLSMYFK